MPGSCFSSSTTLYSAVNAVPPLIREDALRQALVKDAAATITGVPSTVVNYSDGGANCSLWFDFADQLSSMGEGVQNVTIKNKAQLATLDLGDRTDPKITILSREGQVTMAPNTRGAGILIMQADVDAMNTGFYFEGLILVYGKYNNKFGLQGNDVVYGSVVALTAGNEKIKLKNGTRLAFSTLAMKRAYKALGRGMGSDPINTTTDGRNMIVTVGWIEGYGS
jgi:hypothetical protein